MDKCQECNCTIYDSRNYREMKEILIKLDKRYENIVDRLCLNCLRKEYRKLVRNKVIERMFNK